MTTLPVKWVQESRLIDWNMDSLLAPGQTPSMVPVVRLSDLDALREGLEALVSSDFSSFNREWMNDDTDKPRYEWLAQRLLAMLPPASDPANAPRLRMAQQLRERSGYGIYDCLEALARCGGDVERAAEYLRTKGWAIRVVPPKGRR